MFYSLLGGGRDMQLTREQLVKAYRSTRTVRRGEERVHKLFSIGQILGFVHPFLNQHPSRSHPFNLRRG